MTNFFGGHFSRPQAPHERWSEEFDVFLRDELRLDTTAEHAGISPQILFDLYRHQFATYILNRGRSSRIVFDEAWTITWAEEIWPGIIDEAEAARETGEDG